MRPARTAGLIVFSVGCIHTYNKRPCFAIGKREGMAMWDMNGQGQQFHRLLQLFAAQLEPARAMEVAWVYP